MVILPKSLDSYVGVYVIKYMLETTFINRFIKYNKKHITLNNDYYYHNSMVLKSKKIPVSISINKDIDQLFERLTTKVIEVEGQKINVTRSKNELYNKAIEYAIENINDWF